MRKAAKKTKTIPRFHLKLESRVSQTPLSNLRVGEEREKADKERVGQEESGRRKIKGQSGRGACPTVISKSRLLRAIVIFSYVRTTVERAFSRKRVSS